MFVNNYKERGFIGILSMLIAATAIAWILFAHNETKGPTTSNRKEDAPGTSYIETNLKAVDKAENAKRMLEERLNSKLDL